MRWWVLITLTGCAAGDRVRPETLATSLGDARFYVVDVRSDREWQGPRGHVPGATHLAWPEVTREAGSLAPGPDQTVVLVCYTGHRSRWSMRAVREAVTVPVVDLKGGMLAWWKRDLPVSVEPADQ